MVQVTKDNAGEIFDKLINEKGLKKAFVAKKMGISQQNLTNKIHRGTFDADLALKAAKVLDINPAIFIEKTYSDFFKMNRKQDEEIK